MTKTTKIMATTVDEAKSIKISKSDDLSTAHLSWLIKSRMRNQTACLDIFTIFETFPDLVKNTEFRGPSQSLVAVGFSLWRAAFLADKSGSREAVFEDAKAFLARILTDNAINYPQDRSSREWTFNYYMTNANNGLLKLSEKWDEVDTVLSQYEKVKKGATNPQRRWNRHQNAFEKAIECLQHDLKQRSLATVNTSGRRNGKKIT